MYVVITTLSHMNMKNLPAFPHPQGGPMTPYTPLNIVNIRNIDLLPAPPRHIFRLMLISMNSFYPLNIYQPHYPLLIPNAPLISTNSDNPTQ